MKTLLILLSGGLFKSFDVVDVIKLGIGGIIFLLAYFSYLLLKQELAKENERPWALKTIKWFMTICIGFGFFYLVDDFIKTPEAAHLSFANTNVDVKPLQEVSENEIPAGYYIDSEYGFAFKKMDTAEWTTIKSYTGFDGIARLNLPPNEVDSARTASAKAMEDSPFYNFINNQKIFVLENLNSALDIKFTDNTGYPEMDYELNTIRNKLIAKNHYNINNPGDKSKLDEQLKEIKRNDYLSAGHLLYKNRLVITVYSKSDLPTYLKKMTVADFFKSFGNISTIEQLVTTPNSILVKGVSNVYSNVLVNNKSSEFRADKLYLIASSEKYFYEVEVTYSPQSNTKTEIYSDLDNLLNSFKLIKT